MHGYKFSTMFTSNFKQEIYDRENIIYLYKIQNNNVNMVIFLNDRKKTIVTIETNKYTQPTLKN